MTEPETSVQIVEGNLESSLRPDLIRRARLQAEALGVSFTEYLVEALRSRVAEDFALGARAAEVGRARERRGRER